MQSVSIFVDGANMYYAQKKLGWFIDFRKVLRKARNRAVIQAFGGVGHHNVVGLQLRNHAHDQRARQHHAGLHPRPEVGDGRISPGCEAVDLFTGH